MEPDGDSSGEENTGATGWLLNPRCKLDGATPEKRKTKHLYLRLDALQDEIVSWLGKASEGWSQNCKSITQSWIDKGLRPRGITRDLRWGVPSTFVCGKRSLLGSLPYKSNKTPC